MYIQTLSHLKCPDCESDLSYSGVKKSEDILSGNVSCNGCKKAYPILGGVLILVSDVRGYILDHVKGIARHVEDQDIPKEFRVAFGKAKKQIISEHIEEDLEAERVNALYVMNHYLKANQVHSPSSLIEELIQKY